MSRSKNTYPGSQKMFSSSYRHFVVHEHNVRALGAGKVADGRRLQATEAHLDDTVRAPDAGSFCSLGCCGMINHRGEEVLDDVSDVNDEDEHYDCKGCGKRLWYDGVSARLVNGLAEHEENECAAIAWTHAMR